MKTRHFLWIVVVLVSIVTACNYTVGDCYPRGESDAADVGVGPSSGPSGAGGFGDTPRPSGGTGANMCNDTGEKDDTKSDDGSISVGSSAPDESAGLCPDISAAGLVGADAFVYCSGGPCEHKCPTGGGFSPGVFQFSTTVLDDGTDKGGGWQEATGILEFYRWTSWTPEEWKCRVKVGMPLRTQLLGIISSTKAANMTAAAATAATFDLMNRKPELPKGIFCSKLPDAVLALLQAKYPGLGASLTGGIVAP